MEALQPRVVTHSMFYKEMLETPELNLVKLLGAIVYSSYLSWPPKYPPKSFTRLSPEVLNILPGRLNVRSCFSMST
jgi:hypothetical protein